MKTPSSELRLTETNSADDSAGRTWGLEGNLFWHVVAGVFIAVLTLLLCFSAMRWSFKASAALAAVPLTLSLTYVFGFRQGKPPGYDRDLLDGWLHGSGFSPDPYMQPEHPFSVNDSI
jgi:hypothetical protein